MTKLDAHYTNPKLTALYDLDSGWSKDRQFYLDLVAEHNKPQNILDLGCGTGMICRAYAQHGHNVTGVDPAEEMLNIGRAKEHGNKVQWIHSNAQSFRPEGEGQFDLIIMTGHAFQVILEEDDLKALFQTLRHNLKKGGRAVFESRNPDFDWASGWHYDMTLKTQSFGDVRERRDIISYEPQRLMSFDLCYDFPAFEGQPAERLISESTLRFWTKEEIESTARDAELQQSGLYGDWDKKLFDAQTDEEMIFIYTVER